MAERDLDAVDWRILSELQDDARVSFRELGRRVALSAPAVAERVRRLEDAGVITGYHAAVDPDAVARPITAFVRSRVSGEGAIDRIVTLAAEMPEVLECHRITGDDCYLMRVTATSVADLERVLARFTRWGPTTTSLVLSSPVTRRALGPPERAAEDLTAAG